MSGEVTASRDNYISSVKARSLNLSRDGYVRIEVSDSGIDDSTETTMITGSTR